MDELGRWSELCQKLGVKNTAQLVFNDLVEAYAEPQRAYHTLDHIHDCLVQFDRASMLAEYPLEIEAALWLHDVVYHPSASDNEERSAEWARNALKNGGIRTAVIKRICKLILATKHRAPSIGGDATLLADIDLSILGQSAEIFDRYESQIRQEYSLIPERAFRDGRAKILNSFLEREFIYQTFFFREIYEPQARKNLTRSITKLCVEK